MIVENFGGIGMCFWCYWKNLNEEDLMEFILVRFGFKMWDIDL
jgi:hypothetical protein